ncbi:protein eva-1 homolog C-like isoform X4 [Anomalospiza imberbis]|uniref:protein eva-1 homolog C-like isoform X4 n=1 Tax=Anomalospiza imberbis TaxID=187417 RepID=UPI00358FA8BE
MCPPSLGTSAGQRSEPLSPRRVSPAGTTRRRGPGRCQLPAGTQRLCHGRTAPAGGNRGPPLLCCASGGQPGAVRLLQQLVPAQSTWQLEQLLLKQLPCPPSTANANLSQCCMLSPWRDWTGWSHFVVPWYLRKVLRNHTAHTCDGEQLLIVCPRKTTISILGAFYGRRVPSTNLCPSPDNASQESTECTSATAHLKLLAECQDQQWCQFSVHSQVFGPDPCPGTHKYLIASYKCRPGNHRVKTVCENDKLRLQCRPKSILAIYSASYGRFLRGKPECDALNTGEPHIECVAPDALRRVSKKCHRKGNCTVAADKATFGDPCLPGMKKQLRVSYTCGVPEKVALYFLCGVSGGLMLLLCIISPKTTFLQEVGEALKDPELGSSSELGRTKLRDEQDEDVPDDSSSDSSFRRLTRTYRATDSIFGPELTAAMEGAVEHQGRSGEEIWMPKESSPYAIHKIKSATK